MAILVAAFALMILGLSIWGFVTPPALFALVRSVTGGPLMFIAVGVRVALAVLFWLAAPLARHPIVFKIFAVLALAAAAGLLLMGKDRIITMIEWWARKSTAFQRTWLLFAIAFCAYLMWAIWPALSS